MRMPNATETRVSLDGVLAHVAQVMRLRRPDVPPWIAAQDLTFGQLRVMFWLTRNGPASMTGMAQWLGVGLATVTGIVERLERRGLVVRRHRDDDRRIVECELTDDGAALVTEVDGVRSDAMRQALGVLDESELFELDRLLRLIIERTREQMP